MFELKSLALEPGVRVSERFCRDIAAAITRCARWHGCATVTLTQASPRGFGAQLETALAEFPQSVADQHR